MPVDGADGAHDWLGFAAGEQLPHAVDPPSGRLVNANEPVAPPDFPIFIGSDPQGAWRAQRIDALLAASDRHTVQDFARMQGDAGSEYARQLLPALLAVPLSDGLARRAAAQLRGWDGTMAKDSAAPLVFNAWLARFREDVLRRAGVPARSIAVSRLGFVAWLLAPGTDAAARAWWCSGECGPMLATALTEASADLVSRLGSDPAAWRWGAVHDAVFDHPVLRFVPVIGGWVGARVPVPGDTTTINRQEALFGGFESVHGAAYRGDYDLADLDQQPVHGGARAVRQRAECHVAHFRRSLGQGRDGHARPRTGGRRAACHDPADTRAGERLGSVTAPTAAACRCRRRWVVVGLSGRCCGPALPQNRHDTVNEGATRPFGRQTIVDLAGRRHTTPPPFIYGRLMMPQCRTTLRHTALATIAGIALTAAATSAHAQRIKTVFVIAMENHNWIQPLDRYRGQEQQIKGNPNAPFINSLVNGTATATINGVVVDISQSVAYTDTYHNVLATPSGHNRHIHPSEPNYIWAEAGSNLGVLDDNDPYANPSPNQSTHQHLAAYLIEAGIPWKSYQEDIDLAKNADGKTINAVRPRAYWTVPLVSRSGFFVDGITNAYNGSNQFSYAAKHNPPVFFTDTNGGNNTTPTNAASVYYAPLQQLHDDLNNNTVARFNWITPDEYNDMHTPLNHGFAPPGGSTVLRGDDAQIAQGDNFLRQIVPMIMASKAYQDHGAIVLWWDESEQVTNASPDTYAYSIPEIVISPLAHPNVGGKPYDAVAANYSHSSDLLTWQEVFGVGPCLRDACRAQSLSDLFAVGAVPDAIVRR